MVVRWIYLIECPLVVHRMQSAYPLAGNVENMIASSSAHLVSAVNIVGGKE
jgi:hypothetical protein